MTRRSFTILFLNIWTWHLLTIVASGSKNLRSVKSTLADQVLVTNDRPDERSVSQANQYRRGLNPSIGSFKLLVILVRFPEDANVQLPTRQYFYDLCNNDIKNYFNTQSYGKYNINECVVMDWITTDNTAAYYAGGNSNLGPASVASKFFLPVLDAIDRQGMDWTQFDVDFDWGIDSILVFHSGYSAEQGVGSCNAPNPNDRIHSQGHPVSDPSNTWVSADFSISLNGFAIASAWGRLCTTNAAPMSVASHEITHTLTAGMGYIPDLYNVAPSTSPGPSAGLGLFDPMSNAWGPNGLGVLNSFSPFVRKRLGWITPTEITSDGVYEIRASNKYPDAYIIRAGFPDLEYLLIENRQQVDYDAAMPGSGLLFYHVDEKVPKQDTPGYPGQSGWPQNGNHFMVALVQADGKYELEKLKTEGGNNGDAGDFWTAGMTLGSDCNVFPNTCSYQGGKIQSTGIIISGISVSTETVITDTSVLAATVTFRVSGLGGGAPTPPPSPPVVGNTKSPAGGAVLTNAPAGNGTGGAVLTNAPAGSGTGGAVLTTAPAGSVTGGAVLTNAPAASNSGGAVLTNAPTSSNSGGAVVTTAPAGSGTGGAVLTDAPAGNSSGGAVLTTAPSIVSIGGSTAATRPTGSPATSPTRRPLVSLPNNVSSPVQSNSTQTSPLVTGDNSTKTDMDNTYNKTGGKIDTKPSSTIKVMPSVRIVFDQSILSLLLLWLV